MIAPPRLFPPAVLLRPAMVTFESVRVVAGGLLRLKYPPLPPLNVIVLPPAAPVIVSREGTVSGEERVALPSRTNVESLAGVWGSSPPGGIVCVTAWRTTGADIATAKRRIRLTRRRDCLIERPTGARTTGARIVAPSPVLKRANSDNRASSGLCSWHGSDKEGALARRQPVRPRGTDAESTARRTMRMCGLLRSSGLPARI